MAHLLGTLLVSHLLYKLLQTVEEKMGLASQLKTMSQTLRDTQLNLGDLQNRCYWLESQMQTFPGQGRAHVISS